jgi:hypothetical protein
MSNCSLFAATFSFFVLVRDFSRESHSLRHSYSISRPVLSRCNTSRTCHSTEKDVATTSGRETGTNASRKGQPMTTSRSSLSSGEVISTTIYGWEEDVSTAAPAVVVAPSATTLFVAGMVLGTGLLAWCAASATETWGPPSQNCHGVEASREEASRSDSTHWGTRAWVNKLVQQKKKGNMQIARHTTSPSKTRWSRIA